MPLAMPGRVGTSSPLPFAGAAEDPQDQLAPLEGREGLGRNLLLNGGFISVSPSQAPFQGRARAPCLLLTRGGGQDKEARRLHIPPSWGQATLPISPHVNGFTPRLLSCSLSCSLSPLAKTSRRTIGESLGIFTN